ncbi:MAG: hypothetical protein IKL07_03810 [Clostridium sp.]|nr:hypothetical protein [Clostridium sp.]
MEKIEPARVFTEMRDYITPFQPVMGRKYTMTHSDETGDLYVTIGMQYAEDKVEPMRDEVRMEFEDTENGLVLVGEVLIDGDGVEGKSEFRNEIFAREMGIALQAIRYADQELFSSNPELDQIPVLIWFRSADPAYNKLYEYGTMSEYN